MHTTVGNEVEPEPDNKIKYYGNGTLIAPTQNEKDPDLYSFKFDS